MRPIIRAIGALVLASTTNAGSATIERYELDNQLRVILRPIEGATSTALVTLLAIGERHDPDGASGMAHLMEHLLVTASAGDTPARTADDWFGAHAPPTGGANAQTGEDYTVIATVFPTEQLDQELRDIASRMRGLRIEQADLDRELPRMETELSNMFGGIPGIAAINLSREAIRPSGEGLRKGGLIEQLQTVTVEQAQRFADAYYKPRNAIIVVAGGFDPADIRERLGRLFSEIAPGEAPPAMRGRWNRADVEPRAVAVDAADWYRGDPIIMTRAYAAPAPGSPHYAPFLVHGARLFQKGMGSYRAGAVPPVQYAMIDDPAVLYLAASVASEDDLEAARESMDALIGTAIAEPGEKPSDGAMVASQFGWMFGSTDVPDAVLKGNPYGVAFGLGRAELMGVDWPTLRQRLMSLTRRDMQDAAGAVFVRSNSAEVVVRVRPE